MALVNKKFRHVNMPKASRELSRKPLRVFTTSLNSLTTYFFSPLPTSKPVASLKAKVISLSQPITFNPAALRNGRSSYPEKQVYSAQGTGIASC